MNDDERREYLLRMTEDGSEQMLVAGDNQGARTDPALASPSAATKAAVSEAIREALQAAQPGLGQFNIGHVVVPAKRRKTGER